MGNELVDLEAAIAILQELEPGAILGVSAKPGHDGYNGVLRTGLLRKCTCGQQNEGWRYPEFIAKVGESVWSVHRDAKTNKISCGTKGYHSDRYSDSPACC